MLRSALFLLSFSLLSLLAGCAGTVATGSTSTTTVERTRLVESDLEIAPGSWSLLHARDSLQPGDMFVGGSVQVPRALSSETPSEHGLRVSSPISGALEFTAWPSSRVALSAGLRATSQGFADARAGLALITDPAPLRIVGRVGVGVLAQSTTNTFTNTRQTDSEWIDLGQEVKTLGGIRPYLAFGGALQPGGATGPWLELQAQTPLTYAEWSGDRTEVTTVTTYEVTERVCPEEDDPSILKFCSYVVRDSVDTSTTTQEGKRGAASLNLLSVAAGWVVRTRRTQWVLGARFHPMLHRVSMEIQSSFRLPSFASSHGGAPRRRPSGWPEP